MRVLNKILKKVQKKNRNMRQRNFDKKFYTNQVFLNESHTLMGHHVTQKFKLDLKLCLKISKTIII